MMSEANDRGTKKWAAMMIPEHEKLLQQLWAEQDCEEIPILDEQQKEKISAQLQLAI